jgi:hypothetical protein
VLSISSQLLQWRRTNNPSFSSLSLNGSVVTGRVAILERRIPGGPSPAGPLTVLSLLRALGKGAD